MATNTIRLCVTGGPAHSSTALGARARWIGATIFTVRDPQIRIFWFILDAIDGLYSIRYVSKVYECAIPTEKLVMDIRLIQLRTSPSGNLRVRCPHIRQSRVSIYPQ